MKHEIKFNGVSEPWCLRGGGGCGSCSVQCPSQHGDSSTDPLIAGFSSNGVLSTPQWWDLMVGHPGML